MAKLLFLVTVIISLIQLSTQGVEDNSVDDSPLLEAAQEILKTQNAGGMVADFMASDGGKQIGDMLMGGGAGDIMQGIGNMMNEGGGGGLDIGMVGSVLNMLNTQQDTGKNEGSGTGFDFGSAIAFANSFMKQDGASDMLTYLPTIINLFSSLYGPEADKTAAAHAGHSWYLPPIVERMHIVFDQFMNSDLGRDIVRKMGGEKFVKIFTDEQGNVSYRRMVDLLENQSFRKHWIKMVTSRLAMAVSYIADPYTQKKYLATAEFFINNFLKSQGFPKSAHFDSSRTAESLTSMIGYIPKRYLGVKLDASPIVEPAVNYIQDLLRLAENKGILGRAINSDEMNHKIADTINLEMIEPVARINRALRFSKKRPKCTKYVMCLANQPDPDDQLSLPGLKKAIAQAVSFPASWFISSQVNIPFWTLYSAVVDGKNCEKFYNEKCADFHVEELKIKEEYVHQEL